MKILFSQLSARMVNRPFLLVNSITIYRLISAPVLLWLLVIEEVEMFKWLLAVSFFTDAIDGYLARKYKVSSNIGSRIDSIADDSTILAAIIGAIVLKSEFIRQELISIFVLVGLLILQISASLICYGRMSSFHTYLAKIAAVFQGFFFIALFFLPSPNEILFYVAVVLTAADLVEEIALVLLLPKWQTNVRGIFWLKSAEQSSQDVSDRGE